MADIRSAGLPATTAGSAHSRLPGYPAEEFVEGPADVARFVTDRIREGADYIKLIADVPGPDQETLDALVAASHRHGKLTVAHAASTAALDMALRARVDMITHAPLDRRLDGSTAARMLAQGCVSIPTLTMMKGIAHRIAAAAASPPQGVPAAGPSYEAARDSVAELHRAGVPILAGTDANAGPGIPFSPRHGESLHDELELLVEAGLSTVEALRAGNSAASSTLRVTRQGRDRTRPTGRPHPGLQAQQNQPARQRRQGSPTMCHHERDVGDPTPTNSSRPNSPAH
jgi:imidazolonepropionase-like amidohydrolase